MSTNPALDSALAIDHLIQKRAGIDCPSMDEKLVRYVENIIRCHYKDWSMDMPKIKELLEAVEDFVADHTGDNVISDQSLREYTTRWSRLQLAAEACRMC